jgi:tRNA U34 5-carboxymethylaminomethyl modifying enzyme MnmG/GidA
VRTFPGRGHLYDIAVVGAGMAGCEAAMAAARSGKDVLLVTTSLDTVYMLAHGQTTLTPPGGTLMAELLASLGYSGRPVERWALHRAAKYALEAQPGIHLLQSNVTGLMTEGNRVNGLRTWEGVERRARVTALCVGSFLGARLRQGRLQEVAGRLGEMAYDELYRHLRQLGLSFTPLELALDDPGEGPAYQVSCHSLRANELGSDHFSLADLEGLYAAGLCARGEQSYEESAADGLSLAAALVGACGAEGDGEPDGP